MRIAISGFGRIGRVFCRAALEKNMNIVAINDVHGIEAAAYLLKYDSVYGPYKHDIKIKKDSLVVKGKKIKVVSEREPEKLPWKRLNIDLVVESTGVFRDRKGAMKHLEAGAKKVIISAPAKKPDITIVPGVNHDKIKKSDKIISMASCTTNCLAPIAKVLNDRFSIKRAFMTTVHAYTNDQVMHDSPHKKIRRGRAASVNMIPTTTGATEAVAETIPELKGKLNGIAIRVPVVCGSIVDFVAELKQSVKTDEVNDAFRKEARGKMKRIIEYSEEEIVSSDIIGNSHSAIVDGLSTQSQGNLVKVLAWYDNEYGYSCRLADLIKMMKK